MIEPNTTGECPIPVTFTEDRIPSEGIGDSIAELIDLYGGELRESEDRRRRFALPLRRGLATSGTVECTLSWLTHEGSETTVTLTCDRDVDAPRIQRVMILVVGVVGALLFTIWPFFPRSNQAGTLAWIGGALAIAVYLLSLKKTSGGIAFDFLQRLARRQRMTREEG
jgi:hypothetical protein